MSTHVSMVRYGEAAKERWRLRWREPGGKERTKTFAVTPEGTRAAERFKVETELRLEGGRPDFQRDGRQRLVDFADEVWDGLYVRTPHGTERTDASEFECHIKPYLGQVRLVDLNAGIVADWKARLAHAGIGDPTIRRSMGVLSKLLHQAELRERIAENPVAKVRRPAQRRGRLVQPIVPDVIEDLREAIFARRRNPADPMIVSMIAYGGPRPSEVLDRSWPDVGEHTLIVDGHLSWGEREDHVKNDVPRVVDLQPALAQDLREYRLACGRPSGKALLFPRPDGQPWQEHDYRNWRKRVFYPAARAVGLERFRPYDLRHTFCSLLLAEGQESSYVAEQAGHSVETLHKTYHHLIKGYRQIPVRERLTMAEQIARARAKRARRQVS